MKRIGIVAALPRELLALSQGAKPDADLLKHGIYRIQRKHVVLVAAGMGSERSTRAVEACGEVEALMSIGLAGSCRQEFSPGSVLEAGVVVDTQSGERYATSSKGSDIVLATSREIASVPEKARLAASYGASMVDMEAATVARLAQARALEFRSIKGISDAFNFELEGMSRFTGKFGSFRTGAFALHVALRPWMWSSAMTLGKGSAAALKALTEEVEKILLAS